MFVKCKNARHPAFPNKLTKDKSYEVIDESGIQYKILDDEGEKTWWGKERFTEA